MKQSLQRNLISALSVSRRDFLKRSSVAMAGAAALSELPFVTTSHAAPDDPIRIGLIGCGGRGTGAALDALGVATKITYPQPRGGYHTEVVADDGKILNKNVQVVALADVFPDRLNFCRAQLDKLGMHVPDEKCFIGFEAYKQLLAVSEINYVLLATPPHFRPVQLMATIEAGKNAFIEKPVAVDGAGVKLVMAAGELAKKKNLTIGSGTLRRKLPSYIETIKRIHDGAIGDLIYACAYWNGNPVWSVDREPAWSDMEWQLRNWAFLTWLGGDHIVEQHVHNLDIMNWVLNAHPLKATALGGRQVRTDARFGQIYDHFAVEYEYPHGVRMFSQTRQMPACENKIGENVRGTKGTSDCNTWIRGADQKETYRYPGKDKLSDGFKYEQRAFIASIRAGKPINEAQSIAESTLTAIMGRDSAYSGRSVEWDEHLNSPRRLGPEKYEMGPIAVPAVPMPGQYKL